MGAGANSSASSGPDSAERALADVRLLAHRLGNRLAAIVLNSDLIAEDVGPELAALADGIASAATASGRLIETIQRRARLEPIDVESVLQRDALDAQT